MWTVKQMWTVKMWTVQAWSIQEWTIAMRKTVLERHRPRPSGADPKAAWALPASAVALFPAYGNAWNGARHFFLRRLVVDRKHIQAAENAC